MEEDLPCAHVRGKIIFGDLEDVKSFVPSAKARHFQEEMDRLNVTGRLLKT